jgi:DNA-binding GntR family transcriptional regulator
MAKKKDSASRRRSGESSDGPLWRKVQRHLLDLIAQRAPGDQLPTDKELANELGDISVQPVIRAMEELVRMGLVDRRSGRKTVILNPLTAFDDSGLSFSHSARNVYGHQLENRLIELARRTIKTSREYEFEREALAALGLKQAQEFYVIVRVRVLDGTPRALHRAYLNPAHFPPSFLPDNDFSGGSLIEIYKRSGYRLTSRNTALSARYPTDEEMAALKIDRKPVLAVDQTLDAVELGTDRSICIEYLNAVYVDWKYRVVHRRPVSERELAGERDRPRHKAPATGADGSGG